jgi:hypothetical protein
MAYWVVENLKPVRYEGTPWKGDFISAEAAKEHAHQLILNEIKATEKHLLELYHLLEEHTL